MAAAVPASPGPEAGEGADEGAGQGAGEPPLDPRPGAFSLPEELHYLNCAYMSPLARRVEEAGREGLRRESVPARLGPGTFFEGPDRVRRRFSALVNAGDPGRVAVLPSVSYGIALCARNLPVEPGENVVVVEGQFPSNVYAWRRLCREPGIELRTVGPGPGPFRGRGERWNRHLLEALDGRTAVVALAPLHWTDGTVFDLEAVGNRAREVGAALVVDGTQAVGALPFDVDRVRPDALICASYKWLLGPYGLAVAYLGPALDGGVPLEETWLGRAGSEDLAGLTDYTDEYGPGAVRYDVGQRASPILIPMLAEALELVEELGPSRIQDYCRRLTRPLVDEAREMGFRVEEGGWRAGHLFGLRLEDGTAPEELREALARRDVEVSVRGTSLRVSPHVYNDGDDVEALLRALRQVAG